VRQVPVTTVGQLSQDLLSFLVGELRDQRTLADVFSWLRAQRPPRTVTEIVTQDEYTHDVIVEWAQTTYLVFDAT
jgi:hypothetical protein